jgi:anti-sigma28 factor (negative regulator of flagellin synthesis)
MFSFLLQAATNAPADAATSGAGTPVWLTGLIAVIGSIVTIFLVPWLRQKANAARAEAEKLKSESIGKQLDNKSLLIEQAKAFALDTAASIAEKRFPALQAKITAGELKLDAAMLKDELRSWGAVLKDKIIGHFDDQGINVITGVGDKYLDELVEWAANKVSPFPGKDTVKALLTEWDGKALEFLANKGVDWVKSRVETENASAGS